MELSFISPLHITHLTNPAFSFSFSHSQKRRPLHYHKSWYAAPGPTAYHDRCERCPAAGKQNARGEPWIYIRPGLEADPVRVAVGVCQGGQFGGFVWKGYLAAGVAGGGG